MIVEAARRLKIRIVVETYAVSRWVAALGTALAKQFGDGITIDLVPEAGRPGGTALDTLLNLEKLVVSRGRSRWADRLPPADLPETFLREKGSPDIVVDLTADGDTTVGAPTLRPLFDGHRGESGLCLALLEGRTPDIVIALTGASSEAPRIVAAGVASMESAAGVGGGMEAVWSRTLLLIIKAIEAVCFGAMPEADGAMPVMPEGPAVIGPKAAALRGAKLVASVASRAAYQLCFHVPYWRVGWRFVGEADDVWSRGDLSGTPWTLLADPLDQFYADPFPLYWQGRDYLFFEALDYSTQKGVIACVEFGEDRRPGPAFTVLEEPWHLSYPFLIEAEGEIWMIPESSLSGEITLYRAVDFPRRWERHATLVANVEAADATIVEHGGKLWMFAVTRDGRGGYSDTLCIWMADRLMGPWLPHPGNPVLINDRTARPAGHMVRRNGQLLRPIQDCRRGYGTALGLARITRLDEQHFRQDVHTYLAPSAHWPGRKLHSLNGNGRIEAIDGSVLRPKLGIAAKWVERRYKPL